jgi:hypothetical protein
MISVRCSALPRIMKCGRSADREGLLVDEHNDAAPLGTAVHDVMRAIVEGLASVPTQEAIENASLRWSVDRKELSILAWSAYKIWEEIGASFGLDPRTEVEYVPEAFNLPTRVQMSGHVDVESIVPVSDDAAAGWELRQLDWKSGRVDRGYGAQVRGYMALGLLAHPECHSATHLVAWLRDQEVEPYRMTRAQVQDFLRDLADALDRSEYVTGNHCSFCPRRATCEARLAMARKDIEIMGGPRVEIADLSPAEIGRLWDMWDRVFRYGESFERAVRALVAEKGEVDIGDRVLSFAETKRREVDTRKAWPVVEGRVDDMADVVTVSLSAAEQAVAAKAGKGKGAAAKRNLAAALDAAGAISIVPIQRLTERRK